MSEIIDNTADKNAGTVSKAASRRILLALFGGMLTANSFLLAWLVPDQQYASLASAVAGALILAVPIFITAIADLVEGKVHMNELVALAILAAFAGEDFRIAGVIAFFLLLTIIIESRTASGAQRSIEELIKLTPTTVHKVTPKGEMDVNVQELVVGDVIRVRPGENFPVDARIMSGVSTVNQASITGESMPLDKAVGDDVYAGTMNLTGMVELTVTRIGEDTTLGKVKDMIMAAEQSRTPIVRIIDRYAGYYTPTVLMLAGIAWVLSDYNDLSRVITVLVIACPCAVVLATPTAVVAAVAAAARLGIFIKNVSHLELAAKLRAFVFDKTGTLTDGLLSVVKLQPSGDDFTPAVLLRYAAGCERFSNHPTALALVKLAGEAGLKLGEAENFKEVPGKGVSAKLDGDDCLVGRAAYIESKGIHVPAHEEGESEGMSVVYVAVNGKLIGWIGLKDKLRSEAPQMINDLRGLGIRHLAMVTGDRASVAEAIAGSVDIDEFRSECLPEDKVAYVEKLKKSMLTAVVGDGVNDAPALAAGDLGIAMGAIGSDIAINSASIALMTNDLNRIPLLITLSRRSRMIIFQNLMLGLVIVVGGIVVSLLGMMTPVWAAILSTASSILVIFNSARLVRTGEELTLQEHRAEPGNPNEVE
ncbi:MAG: heavy metal translocating P-type ATPase [Victivallaceae bacterium]|nr:cation-translocating P-type ATPase [Victivallaceae bacterium]